MSLIFRVATLVIALCAFALALHNAPAVEEEEEFLDPGHPTHRAEILICTWSRNNMVEMVCQEYEAIYDYAEDCEIGGWEEVRRLTFWDRIKGRRVWGRVECIREYEA